MTTPTHYNEQAYSTHYGHDPQAMSPNALNTAAAFVEGLYFWARDGRQKTGDTYRAQLKATATALERAATAEQSQGHTHAASAYQHAARQLRGVTKGNGKTHTKEAATETTRKLTEGLRAAAVKEHRHQTEDAEAQKRERAAEAARIEANAAKAEADRKARREAKGKADDQKRPRPHYSNARTR